MRSAIRILLPGLALLALAWPALSQTAGSDAAMCPMEVTGTQATVEDTQDGVALAFTNSAGNVDDLRTRIHQMADAFNAAGGHPAGMVAAEASAQDTEFGSRLVLAPTSASDLDALRTEMHGHETAMQGGECPMMALGLLAQAPGEAATPMPAAGTGEGTGMAPAPDAPAPSNP